MTSKEKPSALELISSDDIIRINDYMIEFEEIFLVKVHPDKLKALVEKERTRIFKDIEIQHSYYGSINLDLILERRMKSILKSINEDEKNETLFTLNLRSFFSAREKDTGIEEIEDETNIQKENLVKQQEEEFRSLFKLDDQVRIIIDEQRIKKYLSLRSRLIRFSTVLIMLLIISGSILLFRLDNVKIDVYEKWAKRFYITNTSKYDLEMAKDVILVVLLVLASILILIMFVGVGNWLYRAEKRRIVKYLYISNNLIVPYNIILDPPMQFKKSNYIKKLSDLIYDKMVRITSIDLQEEG